MILKNEIQNINTKLFLSLLLLLYVLVGIILNWYIITDDHYYKSLGNQLDVERIRQLLTFRNKWDWIGFLIIPLLILVKISLVAVCLEVGNFIIDLKLKFKQLFKIALLGEAIFLIAALTKIIYFLLFPKNVTLEFIQTFYPLSLINMVVIEKIPAYLVYPLQLINVFELLYWIILAYLIKIYTNSSFDKSFGFVAKTYGIGLFTWVVLVVFLSIN